eukprot:TRINITY_DN82100_c0_g1_i1.p1 TRINITY_DN82100_c0_g1~~TRINITY_DN82100_c0_g1_i1.p1  ORF type:complete len:237 (-),score=19.95 TRINITY_DN82100_c0_g1_i1:260-970(-)
MPSAPHALLLLAICSLTGAAAVNCSGALASSLQSSDSSCPGTTSLHWWPVLRPPTDCHAWKYLLPAVGVYYSNSANNIRFSSDGKKLLYTSFPRVTDCSGSSQDMEITLDVCASDGARSYHKGHDYSCFDESSRACTAVLGVPRFRLEGSAEVSVEATIFLNGEECDGSPTGGNFSSNSTDATWTRNRTRTQAPSSAGTELDISGTFTLALFGYNWTAMVSGCLVLLATSLRAREL